MPTFAVWGLSVNDGRIVADAVKRAVRNAVRRTTELNIKDLHEVTVYSPADLEDKQEVRIDTLELWKLPGRTPEVLEKLSRNLVDDVFEVLVNRNVYCPVPELVDHEKSPGYSKKFQVKR